MKRLLLLAVLAVQGMLAYGQDLSLAVLNKAPYYFEKVGLENSSGDFVYLYRNGDMKNSAARERNLVCFYVPDEGKLIPFAPEIQEMSVKTHAFWIKGNQYVFLFESYSGKMMLETYDVKSASRTAVVRGTIPVFQGSKDLDTDRMLFLKQKKLLYVSLEEGQSAQFKLNVYNFGTNESKQLADLSPNLDAVTGRMQVPEFNYNPATDAFSWK